MIGELDTSFQTTQRDLFESGLVAEIGPNAFAVWCAIKAHADYNSGVSWPSVRRLMELTGLASGTVQRALTQLEGVRMLRRWRKASRVLYVARERLDVRLGARVLCTVVVDYVPFRMRGKLDRIRRALKTGEIDSEAFADVEIIPGPGFVWDGACLRNSIPVREVPVGQPGPLPSELEDRVKRLREKARERSDGGVVSL